MSNTNDTYVVLERGDGMFEICGRSCFGHYFVFDTSLYNNLDDAKKALTEYVRKERIRLKNERKREVFSMEA